MPIDSDRNIYFEDREDAAGQLIRTLPIELFNDNEPVVIGVSEGGVYFADKIAQAVNGQMDILLTEAILAPNNPDLAIAMVSETEEVVMHKALIDAFGICEDYVYGEAQRKYEEEVLSYVYKYRKGKEILPLAGKYVVLADECVETGLTMMVALKSVIARGAKDIYIATPILDRTVYHNLLNVCDGVFCPHKIDDYISIEYYYKKFDPLSFEDISEIIDSYERREEHKQKKIKDIVSKGQ
jgi:putative phosphoribosyl transferase